jgi:PAS domain S-box-containing protein
MKPARQLAPEESEKFYQTIFENLPFIAFTLDREGGMLEANKCAEQVFGLRIEDVMGKKFSELAMLGKKDLLKAFIEFRKNLHGKVTEKTVYKTKLKNGREILLELVGIPLKEGKKVIKVLDIGSDITERKKAEEELRENEEHLRTILDSIQAGIVIIDAETHSIIDVNPIATRMIGSPKEKIIGSVCHNYICPAERGKCPITDLGQKVDNSERVLLKANGEKTPILKTVTLIMLKNRRCLLESFVDLTERKKMEEDLKRRTEELERFNKLGVGRELKMVEMKKRIKELEDLLRKHGIDSVGNKNDKGNSN